jgi:hypothetical protein
VAGPRKVLIQGPDQAIQGWGPCGRAAESLDPGIVVAGPHRALIQGRGSWPRLSLVREWINVAGAKESLIQVQEGALTQGWGQR